MNRRLWLVTVATTIFLLGSMCSGTHQDVDTHQIAVIPKPQSVAYSRGDFILSRATRLKYDQADTRIKEIQAQLSQALRTTVLSDQGRGIIELRIDGRADIPPAGYRLRVRRKGIRITAKDPAGLFYGTQTLRQLIPADGSGKIPCLDMTDFPAFGWRGLMLDCSRTFLPKDYILKTIDRLAAVKMNVLHLHLTDDQGWRIATSSAASGSSSPPREESSSAGTRSSRADWPRTPR